MLRSWFFVAVACCALFYGPTVASAGDRHPPTEPQVEIYDDVDAMNYPTVTAYVDVYNAKHEPLLGLENVNFVVNEMNNLDSSDPKNAALIESDQLYVEADRSRPIELVVVLNRGTHIEEDWNNLRQAVADWLQNLTLNGGKITLIVYSDRIYRKGDLGFSYWSSTPNQAIDELRRLPFDYSHSVLDDALLETIERLNPEKIGNSQRDPQRAVIVITDRGHTSNHSKPKRDEVLAKVRAMVAQDDPNRYRPMIPFYILCYGDLKKDHEEMEEIAHLTKGKAEMVANSTEIAPTLAKWTSLIRHGYRLTYRSNLRINKKNSPPTPTINDHTLRIALNGVTTAMAQKNFRPQSQLVIAIDPDQISEPVTGTVTFTVNIRARTQISNVFNFLDQSQLALSQDFTNIGQEVRYVAVINTYQLEPNKTFAFTVQAHDLVDNFARNTVTFAVPKLPSTKISLEEKILHIGDKEAVTLVVNEINANNPISQVTIFTPDGPAVMLAQEVNQGEYTTTLDTTEWVVAQHKLSAQIEYKDRRIQVVDNIPTITTISAPKFWQRIPPWVYVLTALSLLLILLLLLLRALWLFLAAIVDRNNVAWGELVLANEGNGAVAYRLWAMAEKDNILQFNLYQNGIELPVHETALVTAGSTATLPTVNGQSAFTNGTPIPTEGVPAATVNGNSQQNGATPKATAATAGNYLQQGRQGLKQAEKSTQAASILARFVKPLKPISDSMRKGLSGVKRVDSSGKQLQRIVPQAAVAKAAPAAVQSNGNGAVATNGVAATVTQRQEVVMVAPSVTVPLSSNQLWWLVPSVEPGARVHLLYAISTRQRRWWRRTNYFRLKSAGEIGAEPVEELVSTPRQRVRLGGLRRGRLLPEKRPNERQSATETTDQQLSLYRLQRMTESVRQYFRIQESKVGG